LNGGRGCRTQFWKGPTQGSLKQQWTIKISPPPFFLFLAWRPSWLEVRITGHKFGRGPSKDYSTKVWLQLDQWFLRRRLKCEMLTDGRRMKSDDNSSHGLKARWTKKPPTCLKSLTNFITLCCMEYNTPWAGSKLMLGVIGTDCIGSCKSNYQTWSRQSWSNVVKFAYNKLMRTQETCSYRIRAVVFNATTNNISVLLVKEMRKPQTCRNSPINFITQCCIEYTSFSFSRTD
jgi:hypothetical protein